ncbi:hypothetical protein C483_05568 [Natrialba hulunbeirensis JCM 10989]|uniref:Uncharacterized protein n=1 Tax=Natrialba hulunbeirensis JCM 10989 TaxID=1227493 RepID=M0A4A3_9EURY|nr:hypothetical protein [Natrialba hulunbeirensis]ELY93409.1 hypothetical protein C483_05568 [Natrialba hulunbeirensis JCM 10989]
MQQCPRRSVLGGIGATMAAAVAGSTVAATDEHTDTSTDTATTSTTADATFDDLLAYLPSEIAQDSMVLMATNYDRLLEANQPNDPLPNVNVLDLDADDISKSVLVTSYSEEYTQPLTVLSGVEIEESTSSRETDAGLEYEYTELDDEDAVVGTDDDVLIVTNELETLDAAVDANAAEATRLLDDESTLEAGMSAFGDSHMRLVRTGDEQLMTPGETDAVPTYFTHAQTVIDADTMEQSIGFEFEDESDISDELIESLEAEFAYTATEEPSVDVDETFVSTTVERDLAAERAIREHDSPGFLRVDRDIDLDDDYLEIELGRGDPTPIEDLTFEVGDEEYDRDIWADGHGKLEEGDTIVMDIDDVEPNLSVRLRHDHELGGSSSGTTVLSNFWFNGEFDVDTGEFTVSYADDFPLDGDRLHLAAYDERPYYRPTEDAPEPKASAQPWTGETLSEGATATLEGVEPGDRILVGWDGIENSDSIRSLQAQPPGSVSFEYDYESETVEATIEFGERQQYAAANTAVAEEAAADTEDETDTDDTERSADEYELLVDGERATTQWAEEYDTVTSGTTIDIDGVDVGTEIEVVWAGTDARIGWTRVRPSVQLEYDDGTVEHVGGEALSASELTADVWTDGDRFEIELADEVDGEFAEGETFAVDADAVSDDGAADEDDREFGTVREVSLRYDTHRVGFALPDR